MRTILGIVVIAVGVYNICLPHTWHRVLGSIAIVVGLTLCAAIWLL